MLLNPMKIGFFNYCVRAVYSHRVSKRSHSHLNYLDDFNFRQLKKIDGQWKSVYLHEELLSLQPVITLEQVIRQVNVKVR